MMAAESRHHKKCMRTKTRSEKSRCTSSSIDKVTLHRNKERCRHQQLNQKISQLCKCVPGNDMKSTKLTQMQRSIRYISFLENIAESLAKELDLSLSADFKRVNLATPSNNGEYNCEEASPNCEETSKQAGTRKVALEDNDKENHDDNIA